MICERKRRAFSSKFFELRGMLRDKWIRFRFSSFASLLRKWRCMSIFSTSLRGIYIDLMFHSHVFYSIACVRSRVCHDRDKNTICLHSATLHVLFPRIINYSLSICPYLRYLLYYILDTYVCARVYISIYTNVRVYLFLYIFTEMFALLLLLTYYTCRRNVRNWLPWSDSFNNRIIVSDNGLILFEHRIYYYYWH